MKSQTKKLRIEAGQYRTLLLITALALPAFGAAPAFAQIDPVGVPSEVGDADAVDERVIVVQARRRDEALLEVPVAVATVSGDSLQALGTSDVRDIGKFVPSIIIESAAGSGAGGTTSLRGVSTSPINGGFEQTVLVEVDGVLVSRNRVLKVGLLDVGQISVLRGPQALYFGKNSPAGVLSIESADPTREFSGTATAAYEFKAKERAISAAVSAPLGDSLAVRVSGRYAKMDGYYTNTATRQLTPAEYPFFAIYGRVPRLRSDSNGSEEYATRVKAVFDNGGPLEIKFSAAYSHYTDEGPLSGGEIFGCPAGATAGKTFGVADPFGECKLDRRYSLAGSPIPDAGLAVYPFANKKGGQAYSDLDLWVGSVRAKYDFGPVTLNSTTGYYKSNNKNFDFYDYTALSGISASENEVYEQFSQELRLATNFDGFANFMVGGFYADTDLTFFNASVIAPLPADAATGKYQSWDKLGLTYGKTYSAFGEATLAFTEQLELSGGVRYTKEKKDSRLGHAFVQPTLVTRFAAAPAGTFFEDKLSDDNWSPEATLSYKPRPNLNLFVSYKTGYKSGGMSLTSTLLGYNQARAAADPSYLANYINGFSFGPEKVKGFEGGLKAELLGNDLFLGLTAYSYDYSDLQVTSFDAATLSFNINNAAKAKVRGVEFEFRYKSGSFLSIFGGANYNDATFDEYISACYRDQTVAQGCTTYPGVDGIAGNSDDFKGFDRSGARLTRAPKWTATLGAQAEAPISDAMTLRFGPNFRYSSSYSPIETGDPRGDNGDYLLFDAAAALVFGDGRYEVSLIGRNLSNVGYRNYTSDKPGGVGELNSSGLSRGRQFQLQGTVRF